MNPSGSPELPGRQPYCCNWQSQLAPPNCKKRLFEPDKPTPPVNQHTMTLTEHPLTAQSSQIRHALKQRKYQLESELIHQERVIDGSEGGYGNEGTALAASFPLKPE